MKFNCSTVATKNKELFIDSWLILQRSFIKNKIKIAGWRKKE